MKTKRNVSVLVGMAAGSEAKGKLIAILAPKFDVMVRTGSINAAHTTYYNGVGYPWHTIPCGALLAPKSRLIIGAGAQIDMAILKREMSWLIDNNQFYCEDGVTPRLMIDPAATIIDEIDTFAENGWSKVCGTQWYKPTECQYHEGTSGMDGSAKSAKTCNGCSGYPKDSLHKALGSTTHGAGYNLMRKMGRIAPDGVYAGLLRDNYGNPVPRVTRADEVPELSSLIGDTVLFLNRANDDDKKILIEGTQGSTLSVHHGYWPYTTSRDTNASNWLMECGMAPSTVEMVYGVTRTFPIRVFGNSGPFGAPELSWEDINRYCYNLRSDMTDEQVHEWLKQNGKQFVCEITTATKRRRRIFMFSQKDFMRSYLINRPDEMMISFIDYLNADDFGKSRWEDLSEYARTWILNLECELGVYFRWLSTGPDNDAMIDRGPIDPHGK